MKGTNTSFRIPLIFIWIGFVSAISFMEAWLKFTAPGVTLTIGLSIGQIVFNALNKVELVLSALLVCLIIAQGEKRWLYEIPLLTAVLIVCIQTGWLLPLLSSPIDLFRSGVTPPPSNAHSIYIVVEAVKILSLIIYGFNQLKIWKHYVNSPLVRL